MSEVFRRLAQSRDERVQDIHLDMPIPTWDGDLVARFDVLDRDEVEKFANRRRSSEGDLDFIIKATRELYMRDSDHQANGAKRHEFNDEYVRIETEEGASVRWDTSLAEFLQKPEDLKTSREVLLFCVKNNTLAIGGLAGKLIMWMQNTDAEIADSLLGESRAPRR